MKVANGTAEGSALMTWQLEALTRLDEVATRCARAEDDFDTCLGAILDAAIFLTDADKGHVQLLDPWSGCLVIMAQHGFDQSYLDFFASLDEGSDGVSGAALGETRRVIVDDVTTSETWAADVLRNAGVHAVQSTPLRSSAGLWVGVLSTHFVRPVRLHEHELSLMDLLARQAADYVVRKHWIPCRTAEPELL